jgi:RHS repeat-associated protein
VRTRARVEHNEPATAWIERYTYTDGLGRAALTKALAEPGKAPDRNPATGQLVRNTNGTLALTDTDIRWVGTGRILYDNKGNPVKAYEPFFDSSPVYTDETDLVDYGVTAITRYDPLSRAIRVDNPNGTYRSVEFDPWQTMSYDENDTVLSSEWFFARQSGELGPAEFDAANKAAGHANTPTITNADTLGRSFQTITDNGASGKYSTTVTLDIQGRTLATQDALLRTVLTQDYDMSGADMHENSIDSGARWLLTGAGGQLLQAWDSRGYAVSASYDALRRPTTLEVTDSAAVTRLAEHIIYGESLPNAKALNLRGAPYQHFDDAGVDTTVQRDFKNNILNARRLLLADYVDDVDWSTQPQLAGADETFTTTHTYDALNRVTATTAPDASVTTPSYNQRSLLAAVSVNLQGGETVTDVVTTVSYNAKAQRETTTYGNGATTTNIYDPDTFRLTNIVTRRPPVTDSVVAQILSTTSTVQDVQYTYDPVGNIVFASDASLQTIFYDNQVAAPTNDYTYDPIYRLIQASGREHISQTRPQPTWNDAARNMVLPSDIQAMQPYVERYAYDSVGNFQTITHSSNTGGWTRNYTYGESIRPPANNRLTATAIGAVTEHYTYDAAGNLNAMPHLSVMHWDWKDQLRATATQVINTGTPETTYYTYDCTGQRAAKATNTQSGMRTAQHAYLGSYEVYREYDSVGTLTLERHSLHIMDGGTRMCLLESTTVDANVTSSAPNTLARYQFSTNLGSAVVELDNTAALISYEEYYPYGSTSLQSGRTRSEVSLKRYRYTGKERDTETGLYYHGARYLAPWLGIWVSCDPVRSVVNQSPYNYCQNNPIRRIDPDGQADHDIVSGLLSKVKAGYDAGKTRIKQFAEFGEVGPYSKQGASRWADPIERVARQTEAEHPVAGAALKYLNPKYIYRSATTIITQRAVSVAKTVGDIRLIKQVKAGAMGAEEFVKRSSANFTRAIATRWAQTGETSAATMIKEAKQAIKVTEEAAKEALPTLAKAAKTGQQGFTTVGTMMGIAGVAVGGVTGLVSAAQFNRDVAARDYPHAVASGSATLESAAVVLAAGTRLAGLSTASASLGTPVAGLGVSGAGLGEAVAAAPHVLGALAVGAAIGVGIQEGSAYLSKKYLGTEISPGQIIGDTLTHADQALTSLIADPSKPAYTQTIGWKINSWLGN